MADAIGLARAVLTDGFFPAATPLAALLGGMALLTLAAGWVVTRSARWAMKPPAARPWRRAAVVSALAILVLTFYPLGWRDAGTLGAIFTALSGMALLFFPVWGITTTILPAMEFTYEDFFDDLFAIYQWLRKELWFAARLFTPLDKIIALSPARKFFGWLNPRKHRWNLIVLVAMMIGLSLEAAETMVEGMPGNLGRLLMVISVYVGLEGAGVVLGYMLLGKYLGIY